MSLRPRPTAVGAVAPRTPSTAAGGTRLVQVLHAGFARRTTEPPVRTDKAVELVYRSEDVGVYARPPSTSTPEQAAALAKALDKDDNKRQIKKLLKKNSSDWDGEMILLASAGASKKNQLSQMAGYDPIAQWSSGFSYMAFTPVATNVVNLVNELNMMNIAHVWLMPDGSINPVTKENMKPWSLKYTAYGPRGMNVPVHWVDDKGELLPMYTPA